MANINISPSQVRDICGSINNWEMKLFELCNSIKMDVGKIDSWRDPQYEMFKNATSMTYNQLLVYIEQLKQMRRSLQIYAENQEEARRGFSSGMNSL